MTCVPGNVPDSSLEIAYNKVLQIRPIKLFSKIVFVMYNIECLKYLCVVVPRTPLGYTILSAFFLNTCGYTILSAFNTCVLSMDTQY